MPFLRQGRNDSLWMASVSLMPAGHCRSRASTRGIPGGVPLKVQPIHPSPKALKLAIPREKPPMQPLHQRPKASTRAIPRGIQLKIQPLKIQPLNCRPRASTRAIPEGTAACRRGAGATARGKPRPTPPNHRSLQQSIAMPVLAVARWAASWGRRWKPWRESSRGASWRRGW